MTDEKWTPTQVMHHRLVNAIGYLDVCYSDISPLSTNGVLKTLLEAVEPLYRPPVEMTHEEEKAQAEREQTIEEAAFDVVKAARAYISALDSRSISGSQRTQRVMLESRNLRGALKNFDEVAGQYERGDE